MHKKTLIQQAQEIIIMKNPKVLEILQVKKYINNNYFLCIFNNNEIIMHKKMLIQQAQEIINNKSNRKEKYD